MTKKIGFFRKTKKSNKRLLEIFEDIQQIRLHSSDQDWERKDFVKRLTKLEKEASKIIVQMLQEGQLKTADDFYRAALIFHHGDNFKSYALAVALAAVSNHLGEPWGKNLYALALDRFLLSVGLPQYFGTQFEKNGDIWRLSSFRSKTGDEERKKYLVEPMSKLKRRVTQLNKTKSR